MNDNESSFWKKPRSKWLFGIPVGGFVMFAVGAIALGVFNTVMHATSTTEFCNGCHSHEQFIQPTYEASSHFANASGVRAECKDCHLPHGWFELTWTKAVVSLDIIPEVMGKISTEEKYLAHQPVMAEHVWAQYRANDSEYCRHCHTFDAMALADQTKMAAQVHKMVEESGNQTCIDCHKGVGHAREVALVPAGSQ